MILRNDVEKRIHVDNRSLIGFDSSQINRLRITEMLNLGMRVQKIKDIIRIRRGYSVSIFIKNGNFHGKHKQN